MRTERHESIGCLIRVATADISLLKRGSALTSYHLCFDYKDNEYNPNTAIFGKKNGLMGEKY